jgi:hypothetical protein
MMKIRLTYPRGLDVVNNEMGDARNRTWVRQRRDLTSEIGQTDLPKR